jgi:hypothetical protein
MVAHDLRRRMGRCVHSSALAPLLLVVSVTWGRQAGDETGAYGCHEEDRGSAKDDTRRPALFPPLRRTDPRFGPGSPRRSLLRPRAAPPGSRSCPTAASACPLAYLFVRCPLVPYRASFLPAPSRARARISRSLLGRDPGAIPVGVRLPNPIASFGHGLGGGFRCSSGAAGPRQAQRTPRSVSRPSGTRWARLRSTPGSFPYPNVPLASSPSVSIRTTRTRRG